MVYSAPTQPPWLVAEALETEAIPAKFAVILAAHSRNVCEDRAALTPEKRLGQGIHSFLEQLSSGVYLVLDLERVMVVGVDPDERVYLMHSLFSVQVDVYFTQRRLFACLGNLPAEGLPLVVDIPDEASAARRSVCAMPRVDHVNRLGGISLINW